jgi:hypothetical protein
MPDSLRTMQYAFAAHIRNPSKQAAPGDVDDRRMQVYRDLFFNNISRFIANSFPVARQMYTDSEWRSLVREFYSEHSCKTPLFPELPKEFLHYLQEQRVDRPGDPPFLLELAHYEWVEIALAQADREVDDIEADRNADLLREIPVLSPLAWPLTYRYPVHRIGPNNRPSDPPVTPTQLLAYRNRSYKVKFMQLNDVTQWLITALGEDRQLTGRQLLEDLARVMQHPNPDRLIDSGHQLLRDFQDKDIVLGCVRS